MFDRHDLDTDDPQFADAIDTDEGGLDDWLARLDFSDLLRYGDDDEPPELLLDVPYVPTDARVVNAMLDLAEVGSEDILYDLGCGDGRIVVTAAMKRGTRGIGIGIDMDPARIADAIDLARYSRVEDLTHFIEADLLEADFNDATVVMLYLLDLVNLELRPRLLEELRPGTRIVSHAFDMADWKPDRHLDVGRVDLYLWLVPAPVGGSWQWHGEDGHRYRVTLEQNFQQIRGRAWLDDAEIRLHRARLRGDLLELGLKRRHQGKARNFAMHWLDGELHPVGDHGQVGPATRP